MATVPAFDVADEALHALGLTPDEFSRELRLAAAALWYDRRAISQEIGSYIAGLNRRDFILGLSRLRVDVIQADPADLHRELEHVRSRRREHLAADHPVQDRHA